MDITQERLKELVDYDDVNGGLIWKKSGPGRRPPGTKVGCKGSRYIQCGIDRKNYLVHRLVFLFHHGYVPDFVDHKDLDTTNNRIENLRPATISQNAMNQRPKSKCGHKGVYFEKDRGKWLAHICKDQKRIKIGRFENIEDAIKARKMAEERLFGEYAGG